MNSDGSRPAWLRWITLTLGACLVTMYAALIGLAYVDSGGADDFPILRRPTATATVTPVPHMLAYQPEDEEKVIHEDFSTGNRDWHSRFTFGKVQLVDGRLLLESTGTDNFAFAQSPYLSYAHSGSMYIQADLTTDVETRSTYGLFFGLAENTGAVYVFEFWPRAGQLRLVQWTSGGWKELITRDAANMRDFPQFNTMAVYYEDGYIELFLNGEMISTYTFSNQEPFRSTGLGIYVGGSGFRVIADDFFAYNGK